MEFYRTISEYTELEGTLQTYRVQFLALHRTPQPSHHVLESKVRNKVFQGLKPLPLWGCSMVFSGTVESKHT